MSIKMLTPWIADATGRTVRALEGRNPNDSVNHVARITGVERRVPSVRIRADAGLHADALNWMEGPVGLDPEGWCERILKSLDYALPEEESYVIQYDDGAFNFGPEGSEMNGFPAQLGEASHYTSLDSAQDKLRDLVRPDGIGARIVRIRDLGNVQAPSPA